MECPEYTQLLEKLFKQQGKSLSKIERDLDLHTDQCQVCQQRFHELYWQAGENVREPLLILNQLDEWALEAELEVPENRLLDEDIEVRSIPSLGELRRFRGEPAPRPFLVALLASIQSLQGFLRDLIPADNRRLTWGIGFVLLLIATGGLVWLTHIGSIDHPPSEGLLPNGQSEIHTLSPSTEADSEIKVAFRYRRLEDPGEFSSAREVRLPVEVHPTLTTDEDRYRFVIKVERSCYLYLFHVTPDSQVYRLFPNAEYSDVRDPLPAGRSVQLPEDRWFRPIASEEPERPFRERVYFITSQERDPRLAEWPEAPGSHSGLLPYLQWLASVPNDLGTCYVFEFRHAPR